MTKRKRMKINTPPRNQCHQLLNPYNSHLHRSLGPLAVTPPMQSRTAPKFITPIALSDAVPHTPLCAPAEAHTKTSAYLEAGHLFPACVFFLFFFWKWRSARAHRFHFFLFFRTESLYSKLGWLWPNVPLRVAFGLVSLLGSYTKHGQHKYINTSKAYLQWDLWPRAHPQTWGFSSLPSRVSTFVCHGGGGGSFLACKDFAGRVGRIILRLRF